MTALAFCFDTAAGGGDLSPAAFSETAGDFIASAIKASLFTNRRDPEQRAGGCWSDALYGDSFGSLLWTKQRSTITPALLVELQQICNDALRWIVDQGYAEAIDSAVERAAAHAVMITITVRQNSGDTNNYIENYELGAQL